VNAGSPAYTSDGIVSASDWAAGSLGLYYIAPTTIQRFRIRFANRALDYYSPQSNSHFVQNCRFETDAIGVYAYYTSVTITSNKVCNVGTTQVAGPGSTIYESGTVTDCNVVNVSNMQFIQAEPAIAINPLNRSNMVIFSVKWAADSLFKAVSTNSGATWSTNLIAGSNDPDGLLQACCDPSAAFDQYGNLFLTYLSQNYLTVVLAVSTNGGNNFKLSTTWPTAGGRMDQPTVVTGPGTNALSSVWLTWRDTGKIFVTGASVSGQGTNNIATFRQPVHFINYFYRGGEAYSDLAIGPNGQVLCTFQSLEDTNGPSTVYMVYDQDGLGVAPFTQATPIQTNNVGYLLDIKAHPTRTIDVEPGLAWDRSTNTYNGRVYLVYTERPTTNDLDFDTDIYVKYATGDPTVVANWSTGVKVNSDSSTNSQFLPRIALDEVTGNVAVGWYDCRQDTNNVKAQFYVAVSQNGCAGFSPNILVQPGQSDAVAVSDQFDYGDYSGLDFSGGYLCPVWADSSNSTLDNPDTTFDIYTAVIRY